MKPILMLLVVLAACANQAPEERYGFVARLGNDTVSLESVARRGNHVVSDEVDRFPLVRQRHTEIDLDGDGRIKRLVMDIHTPSEPEDQRDRRVEVTVRGDAVRISKRDKTGTKNLSFDADGGIAMAHLPQMYSLYELYLATALKHGRDTKVEAGKEIQMRQFYIDREFDHFPLHRGWVRDLGDGKADIRHDWLAGFGDATLDSSFSLLTYSGVRSTYQVNVTRVSQPPDARAIGERFAAAETKAGAKQLSIRDTSRTNIGVAAMTVEYSRPLMRGRVLLGGVIPYGQVWRTGANAATHFMTSAPIKLGELRLAAGAYTLWTVPREQGVDLIVNTETGQWGTGYNPGKNLGTTRLTSATLPNPVEMFTISIVPGESGRGELVLEWGSFRWSAPIVPE